MTISKLYLVVCAAALCAGVVAVRANDNPDQAAARAALEAKMRQLNTAPATNNPPPSAPATAPAASASPSANPQPSMNPAGPATGAPARMEQTEHASTASNRSQSWFQTVPPPSGGRPATREPQTTTGPESTEPKTSSQPNEEHPQPVKTFPTKPQAPAQPVYTERQQNPNATYPGKRLGLNPIQAPPLPINQTQQEQLRELLQKYEANSITPEQYQTERARILNGR